MEETRVVRVVEETEKAPRGRGPVFGRRPRGREFRSRSSDLLARVLVALPLIVIAIATVMIVTPPLPTLTDDPLVPGTTPIKVAHVEELRAAIGTLRARQSMGAFTWTDEPLGASVTAVKLVHLAELRQALTEVYQALKLPVPVFTPESPIAHVTAVAAAHIAELRAAVVAVW